MQTVSSARAERIPVRRMDFDFGPDIPEAWADGKGAASPGIRDLEERLTRAMGTKVQVRDHGNKGEIAIPYANLDALDRIIDKLL